MIDFQKIDDALIDRWLQPAIDRIGHVGIGRHDLAMAVLTLGAAMMIVNGAIYPPVSLSAMITDAITFGNVCALVWISWIIWHYRRIDGDRGADAMPRSRLDLAPMRRFLLVFLPFMMIPLGPPTLIYMLLTVAIGIAAMLPFWIIACRPAPPPKPRTAFAGATG